MMVTSRRDLLYHTNLNECRQILYRYISVFIQIITNSTSYTMLLPTFVTRDSRGNCDDADSESIRSVSA